MLTGVQYQAVTDAGLEISIDGKEQTIPADNIVICAGQLPLRELAEPLQQRSVSVHLIGGADVAAELDAKRAIRQGSELAARL